MLGSPHFRQNTEQFSGLERGMRKGDTGTPDRVIRKDSASSSRSWERADHFTIYSIDILQKVLGNALEKSARILRV